jgi:hypothetical protein
MREVMTASDWLTSTQLKPMLRCIQPTITNRQLRLFAIACCSHILGRVPTDPNALFVVDAVNRYVEGTGGIRDIEAAFFAIGAQSTTAESRDPAIFAAKGMGHMAVTTLRDTVYRPQDGSHVTARADLLKAALATANYAAKAIGQLELRVQDTESRRKQQAVWAEREWQCDCLRDIVFAPTPPPSIDPLWKTATVVSLARGIYQEQAFDHIPILADALQDAGCEDLVILSHCRPPNAHVRGCWLLEQLVFGESPPQVGV